MTGGAECGCCALEWFVSIFIVALRGVASRKGRTRRRDAWYERKGAILAMLPIPIFVLTLADAEDIAGHLEESLGRLSGDAEPAAIIACDCILRRVEAEQNQTVGAVSRTLARHRVVGFNTYGEQFGGMHLNQTFTGAAIYPPDPTGA